MSHLKTSKTSKMSYVKKFLSNGGLFGILIFALLIFAIRSVNLKAFIREVINSDFKYLILGLFFMFVFVCCEAANIAGTFKMLGSKQNIKNSLKYACAGFFFSSITPSASGGQPMQVFYMVHDGNSGVKGCLVLLLNFLCYQVVSVFYGLMGYIFYGRAIFETRPPLHWLFIISLFLVLLVIAFTLLAMFRKNVILAVGKFIKWLVKLFSKDKAESFGKAFSKIVDEYSQGAIYIMRHPMQIVRVMLVTMVQIGMLGAVTCAVYLALGVTGHSLIEVFFTQSIITLAASVAPLPGAVGVNEGVFYFLFSRIFPSNKLASAMILTRGISFYLPTFITAIVCAVSYTTIKRKKLHSKIIS